MYFTNDCSFRFPPNPPCAERARGDCEASFAAAILPQGWALADRLSFCFGHTLLVAGTVENDARRRESELHVYAVVVVVD